MKMRGEERRGKESRGEERRGEGERRSEGEEWQLFSVYLTRIGGKHNVVIAQIIGDEIKCEGM